MSELETLTLDREDLCRYCGLNRVCGGLYCSPGCAADADLHRQRQADVDNFLEGRHSVIHGLTHKYHTTAHKIADGRNIQKDIDQRAARGL